ncbi:hypothetical protein AB0C51_07410 [Streptomyces pathocidini]|uniref:hypothetical protein n=1 Tax=Streptomyces pathocidini TaxID=1650571 RepID=UPI00340A14EA
MRTSSRVMAASFLIIAVAVGGPATTVVADDQTDYGQSDSGSGYGQGGGGGGGGYGDQRLTITPSMPKEGSSVTLIVKADCEAPAVKVESDGFSPRVAWLHDKGGGKYFVGSATVVHHAKKGDRFQVTAKCTRGETMYGGFTIGHGAWKGSHAGLGGSAGGVDTTSLAAGGALLAAAVGGSILVIRRRSGSHS